MENRITPGFERGTTPDAHLLAALGAEGADAVAQPRRVEGVLDARGNVAGRGKGPEGGERSQAEGSAVFLSASH
jgi:hypothetical protein